MCPLVGVRVMPPLLLLILLAILATDQTVGDIPVDEFDDDQLLTVVPCIRRLCKKYFHSERALKGSLAIINIKPDASAFQLNILKSFNEDARHEMGVMVKDARRKHWNASHVTEKAKNYLMLIGDSSELAAPIRQLRRLPTWNPLAQVVVLFTVELTPLVFEIEVRNVLQELFDNSVLNVNVMVQRYNTSVLEVWTWFPYESGGCADNIDQIRLVDECEYVEVPPDEAANVRGAWMFRERHHFSDYGPKIPKYYNYCPLKISTSIWEPFVVGNESHIEKGLEVLMLDTITARMRLIPVYNVIEATRATARIIADNQTGLYADVIQRRTDLMIGGLYENPISRKLLSATIPYYQDDLTWCVPTARHAPKWLNVFIIFNVWTWLIAIFIIFAAAGLLYRFNYVEGLYRENYTWVLLQSLAFSLSVYAHYWPRRVSIRFFLIGYMFYGLHWNAAYHSFLISVLTRPRYEPQIASIGQAIEAEFRFAGAESTLPHFDNFLISVLTRPRYEPQIASIGQAIEAEFRFAGAESTLPHFDKPDPISRHLGAVYRVCPRMDECLARLRTERLLAVAISRAHSSNSRLIGEAEMYCFPKTDNIYTYSVSMLAKKDFHLLPKMNDLIRRISESGLLGKWQKESEKIRIDADVEEDEVGADGQTTLRLDHIEGAFLLGAVGLGLSLVAFVAELVYYRAKRNYRWRNNLLDRFLC
uniref:Putative ionotropic receptor ligand binding domain-containing protein n=1 Tax=Anopheles atroparvus TaxID=41427 RepID=A0A182J2K2_ANOAO